jgi:hypothetical protein
MNQDKLKGIAVIVVAIVVVVQHSRISSFNKEERKTVNHKYNYTIFIATCFDFN